MYCFALSKTDAVSSNLNFQDFHGIKQGMMAKQTTTYVYWLPPLIWMGLLLYVLTKSVDPETVGHLPAHTDKVVHFIIFAILAWLWYPALRIASAWPVKRAVWVGFALAVAYGAFTEYVQTHLAHRSGEWADVLANTLGAATLFLIHFKSNTPIWGKRA